MYMYDIIVMWYTTLCLYYQEASLLADRDSQHMKKLEEWQELRESQHKQEIDRIQNMLMSELREMQEKQQATQVFSN